MIPQGTSKVFLTFTLKPGTTAEPPVENRAFLDSLLEHGLWIRALAALSFLDTVEKGEASRAVQIACTVGFYQQLGMSTEDTLTNLIAWSIWSRDKNRSLPDLMDRIALHLGPQRTSVSSNYVDDVRERFLTTSKRIDVQPRDYLAQLRSTPLSQLPGEFGIEWKRNPSVKLVPKKLAEYWNKLPEYLAETLRHMTDPLGAQLAACYNKIKHGPQMILMDPAACAASRGFSEAEIRLVHHRYPGIRILRNGSRTQESADETESAYRVAPFLVEDPKNMRRFFFQVIVHQANLLKTLGTWLYNTTFPDPKRDFLVSDPALLSLVERQSEHLVRTFHI